MFATTQLTQASSAVFVIDSGLLWCYCTIIGCVMRTCASWSYGIYFGWTGGNR